MNAIALAVEGLAPVVAVPPLEVEVGGLTFVEVLSATRIHGGVADNVVPDRVEVRLNYRYAPNRTPAEAEARLRELVGADVEIDGELPARACRRRVAARAAAARRRAASRSSRSRRGRRSPSSRRQGLDAVNFGPGATRYAHRRDERVEIAALERCYEALRAFVSG